MSFHDKRRADQMLKDVQKSAKAIEFKWTHVHSLDELEAFYRSVLPKIHEAAKGCGYALGVHGTLRRDLDLIAVPWDIHLPRGRLAGAIQRAACGLANDSFQWQEKPYGRVATAFAICWPEWEGSHDILSLGCIDLSIMPAHELAASEPKE